MTKQVQIICIDDEPGIIDLVKLVLKSDNIEVMGAKNGPTGLDLIRQHPPAAVILDIMMPGMDGWEVYNQIRTDDALKDIPVIILTARNSTFEEVIARARAGVDDYLIKPFEPDALKKSIAKVLAA